MSDQELTPQSAEEDPRVDQIESVLLFLGQSLVPRPEAVSVRKSLRGDSVRFSVQVPSSDLGKVIGRGGRIANAIRTLVQVAGTKAGLQTAVEFSDGRRPQNSRGGRGRFQGNRPRRRD